MQRSLLESGQTSLECIVLAEGLKSLSGRFIACEACSVSSLLVGVVLDSVMITVLVCCGLGTAIDIASWVALCFVSFKIVHVNTF